MSADKFEGTPVTWAEIIEGARAERLRSFCADPTGYVLKEMQTNGNFSSTGLLIQNLNEQNTKLRAELAAAKKALAEARETHTMQLAAISTAVVQNTRKAVSERITWGNPYCTRAYLDVCKAVDREIDHREARYGLERELNGWRHVYAMERQTAANKAKQRAAGQQTPYQKRDEINQFLTSLGLGGSFTQQIAQTAISVGNIDVEDHRVANAVRDERGRIIQKLEDARNALLEYGGPRPVGFWEKLFAKETHARAHVAADTLYEMRACIRLDQPFDVLTTTRPD